LQELKEAEGKAKIFEQKATLEVKEFLEKEKLLLRRQQKQQAFVKATAELINKKTETLSLFLPSDKKEKLCQIIVEDLPQETNFKLQLEKATKLSLKGKVKGEENLNEQVQRLFTKAVATAITKLQDEGISFTKAEKEAIFSRLRPNLSDLPLITQQLAVPAEERKEMLSWTNKSLSPFGPAEEAKKIMEILTPALAEKLPEIKPETINQITEEQFSEIKKTFIESITVTLAEMAPEVKEIPPQKINLLFSAFIPQNKEELKEYSSVLAFPKENKVPLSLFSSTETVEVTRLPTVFPRFLATPFQRAAEGNLWQIQNQYGLSFADEIRIQLSQDGINKNNAFVFRSKVLDRWALYLTAEKITPADIDYTIEKLLSAGENKNSPKIKELEETRERLTRFQQALPASLVEEIKRENLFEGKTGKPPVKLPSRFGTAIIRKNNFDPKFNLSTRINAFFGRVFGKQTIILSSGQTVYINKFAFLRHRLSEAIKTAFFKTSFGRGVQTGLKKLAQNSLQALWKISQTGVKKILKTGIKAAVMAILHAIGVTVSAGLLNVIVEVAPKLLKAATSLIKKSFKAITSLLGITNAISEGLTGQREIPEDKTFSWLKYLVVGFFILLLVAPLLKQNNINTTFLQRGSLEEEGVSFPPGSPPHCTPARHLAEEVICTLSTGNAPCNHNIVDEYTWNDVSSCLDKANLTKSIVSSPSTVIKDNFSRFLLSVDGSKRNLQCVGFVVGIESGLGRNIEKPGNARDYLDPPYPDNYILIDKDKVKTGDIAIWKGKKYGHIAVIIQVINNPDGTPAKIVTAESDGYSGMIAVR
ncbi:MAG: CHAP domain-containing protein, partial [Microgenomates group bacterium]